MRNLLDESGRVIDLESVDAIGQLNDGRFEIWLDDERRKVTRHPRAFEIWVDHLRSKNSRHSVTRIEPKAIVSGGDSMQPNLQSNPSVKEIVANLRLEEDRFDSSYHTPSVEQYRMLLDAAFSGKLDGLVSIGRSGIYLNKCRIKPPSDA